MVLGKAEVRHICATLAVEQDVRRLQIAVDELMGVKRPNALGYLQAKGDRRLQLEGPSRSSFSWREPPLMNGCAM